MINAFLFSGALNLETLSCAIVLSVHQMWAVPRIAALFIYGARKRIRLEQITSCLSPSPRPHTPSRHSTEMGRASVQTKKKPNLQLPILNCFSVNLCVCVFHRCVSDHLQTCATRRSQQPLLAPAKAAGTLVL